MTDTAEIEVDDSGSTTIDDIIDEAVGSIMMMCDQFGAFGRDKRGRKVSPGKILDGLNEVSSIELLNVVGKSILDDPNNWSSDDAEDMTYYSTQLLRLDVAIEHHRQKMASEVQRRINRLNEQVAKHL